MKNIWAFIKWQLSRWDQVDYYLVGLFSVMITLLFAPKGSTAKTIFVIVGVVWVATGIIWGLSYLISQSYKEFCRSRNKLFIDIKNSDK